MVDEINHPLRRGLRYKTRQDHHLVNDRVWILHNPNRDSCARNMTGKTIFAGLNIPVLEIERIRDQNNINRGSCGSEKTCICTSNRDKNT